MCIVMDIRNHLWFTSAHANLPPILPTAPHASGPVFARVTLVYTFGDGGNVTLEYTLFGSDGFVTVDERYASPTVVW